MVPLSCVEVRIGVPIPMKKPRFLGASTGLGDRSSPLAMFVAVCINCLLTCSFYGCSGTRPRNELSLFCLVSDFESTYLEKAFASHIASDIDVISGTLRQLDSVDPCRFNEDLVSVTSISDCCNFHVSSIIEIRFVPIPFPAPDSGASAGLGALPSGVQRCGEVDAGENAEVFAFWQDCGNLGNSHEYGRGHTFAGYSLREVYRLRLRLELFN